jgi:hypothetical protein
MSSNRHVETSLLLLAQALHARAEAVKRFFVELRGEHNSGHTEENGNEKELQVIGAKGGTRTPTVLPARS